MKCAGTLLFLLGIASSMVGCQPKLDPDIANSPSGGSGLNPPRPLPSNFLGIELDKPLNMPVCISRDGFMLSALDQPALPCSDRPALAANGGITVGNRKYPAPPIKVLFDSEHVPDSIEGEATLSMEKGVVRGVTVRTRGLEVQQSALSFAISHFGPPTSQRRTRTRGAQGRNPEVIYARWVGTSSSVQFFGASIDTDNGYIFFLSSKGH